MKTRYVALGSVAVLACFTISSLFADIQNISGKVKRNSPTDQFMADSSDTETTTMCDTNPITGNSGIRPVNVPLQRFLEETPVRYRRDSENNRSFTNFSGSYTTPTTSGVSSLPNDRPGNLTPGTPSGPDPGPEPQPQVTPEPATLLLLGLGLVATIPFARRRENKSEEA